MRMRKPCCDKSDTNKGAWSKQEDEKLVDYIRTHGEGCWRSLPTAAGLYRCGKSCRLRWINYLRPDIKRGNFAQDEEDLIIKLHALLGNRWSLIAGRLPGRTDNEVKNYWNTYIRKKLLSNGIDPNNHRLAHSISRTQKYEPDSETTAPDVAPSKNDASESLKLVGDKEQVLSDAASCLEDQETSPSHDLNLDLTIAFPSPSSIDYLENKEESKEVTIVEEVQSDSFPTLFLFR